MSDAFVIMASELCLMEHIPRSPPCRISKSTLPVTGSRTELDDSAAERSSRLQMATDSPRVVVGTVVGVVGDETATLTNEDDDAVASIGAMSVKELKAAVTAAGLSTVGCLEKRDFVTLLTDHRRAQTAAAESLDASASSPPDGGDDDDDEPTT